MAHIKAQPGDWLDEAWCLSAVIAEMPDGPPGLLTPTKQSRQLGSQIAEKLERLRTKIALHLTYRIRVVHKLKMEGPDGVGLFFVDREDPSEILARYAAIASLGVKFAPIDEWAIDAQAKIARVLVDRYVCKEWKRTLPLIVASIGGASSSQRATLSAAQPRSKDRRGALAIAVSSERKKDPSLSAAQVLHRLCGGDVVKELKDERVWYWEKSGALKSVGLDRFETIFSEQKPPTG